MFKKFICLFLLTITTFSYGKIVECSHFSEIYDHIDEKTLLILDIDDTLLIPEQMLGSDEWFLHQIETHKKNGLSKENALEKALAEWEAIRHMTRMNLVEPNINLIIKDLQQKHFSIMGLTTQGLALATRTSFHLSDNDIDLSKNPPTKEDHYFLINNHGVLFRNGILFTSGTSKGDSFKQLCQCIGLYPKKIIFINDKASHLQDLESFANKAGIEFIGLRYGYSDFRKKAFCKEIANYQFSNSSFSRLIPDHEAKENLTAK